VRVATQYGFFARTRKGSLGEAKVRNWGSAVGD